MLTLSEMERSRKLLIGELGRMKNILQNENRSPTDTERQIVTALLDRWNVLDKKIDTFIPQHQKCKFNNKKIKKRGIKYEDIDRNARRSKKDYDQTW